MAKYEEWITEDGLQRLEGWARDGLTDEQIAHNIGINRATLYTWKRKYPDLKFAIEDGKKPVDFEVENSLLKSALGFEYEETKVYQVKKPDGSTENRVEKTTKYQAPNVTAQIFWLKNRKPEQWSDRKDVHHGGEVSILEDILSQIDEEDDIHED